MNRTMQEITINEKLSLVEFRDEKTQELDLSRKGYKDAEAIIIRALLQVLFSSLSVSCCLYAFFHHSLLPPPSPIYPLLTLCHNSPYILSSLPPPVTVLTTALFSVAIECR